MDESGFPYSLPLSGTAGTGAAAAASSSGSVAGAAGAVAAAPSCAAVSSSCSQQEGQAGPTPAKQQQLQLQQQQQQHFEALIQGVPLSASLTATGAHIQSMHALQEVFRGSCVLPPSCVPLMLTDRHNESPQARKTTVSLLLLPPRRPVQRLRPRHPLPGRRRSHGWGWTTEAHRRYSSLPRHRLPSSSNRMMKGSRRQVPAGSSVGIWSRRRRRRAEERARRPR